MAHTARSYCRSPAAARDVSWFERHPTLYRLVLILYYLGIILALIALYGRGEFKPPPFVYQGF